MSVSPVFNEVLRGAITFTGNTVGLSKAAYENTAGIIGSIGAFTSLDNSLEFADFGKGTTLEISENGSMAYLDIQENSTVKYALLTWSGFYYYNCVASFEDRSEERDKPITFNLSNGESKSLTFEKQYIETEFDEVNNLTRKRYSNTVDVTDYVKKSGGGQYSVQGVTGITEPDESCTSSTNFAGWTLSVVYENDSLPERTLCIWSGLVGVYQEEAAEVEVVLDGFKTSKVSDVNARLLISAGEGDADIVGDKLEFGKDRDNLSIISGPNNPAGNFFSSQINNDLGELDTRGTFGDKNHDAINGINIVGGRQGWDITNIDVSSYVENYQESAVMALSTGGDVYVVNTIGLQIDTPLMMTDFVKSANTTTAYVGDAITYNIVVTNTGVEELVDVLFMDEDGINTKFIADSVTVNGVSIASADPNKGFNLGSLAVEESAAVTFMVQVTSVDDGYVSNTALIEKENSSGKIIDQMSNTVSVEILVKETVLEISETVDKNEAELGEMLTYTVTVENVGGVEAEGNYFFTNIDRSTTFVDGSVTVNGVLCENYNPVTGFNLADISAGEEVIIQFCVLVNDDADVQNSVVDSSTVEYKYKIGDVYSEIFTADSNEVVTTLFIEKLDIVKSSSSYKVSPNGNVEFLFTLENSGNKTISNIYFTDQLVDGLEFVENSVYVNSVAIGTALSDGIYIDEIAVYDTATIRFTAKVTGDVDRVTNIAKADYQFIVGGTTVNRTAYSNEVEIMILSAEINQIVKFVNTDIGTVGDILKYTLEFENTGSTTAINVNLTDETSEGVEFVEDSLFVNGKNYTGEDVTKGVNIPDIIAKESVVATFEMKVVSDAVTVVTDAAKVVYSYLEDESQSVIIEEVVSNTVEVEISSPSVTVTKSADKEIVVLGDTVMYSLTILNDGKNDLVNVDVVDLLDQNLSFVEGTVTVDGVTSTVENPTSKIIVGDIAVGGSVTVTFDAVVTGNDGEKIQNQATVTADYISKNGIVKSIGAKSNICTISLRFPTLEIAKKASATTVVLGDVIEYTVTLTNSGDTDLYEVLFVDNLSTATEFVNGSFTLNGEVVNTVDLQQGVVVGEIGIGETATISYSVTVISGACNKKIENSAKAFYSYQYASEETATAQTEVAQVVVMAEISNFKQISLNSKVEIPSVKPDLYMLDNTVANTVITDYYVVDVINGVSNEGQRLYGKKLIVHGEVKASIEYTEPCDSVHSAHWNIPFTTYIVLPKDFTKNKDVVVTALVENVSSQAINCREVEINTLALVVATIK